LRWMRLEKVKDEVAKGTASLKGDCRCPCGGGRKKLQHEGRGGRLKAPQRESKTQDHKGDYDAAKKQKRSNCFF